MVTSTQINTLKYLYDLELNQRNHYFKDALTWYNSVMVRYKEYGMNFSFPEFEPIIFYLEFYLDMLNINKENSLYYHYLFIKQQLAQVKQKVVCETQTNETKTEMNCDDWDRITVKASSEKQKTCRENEEYSRIMTIRECPGEYELALNGNNYPYAYTLRVILNVMDFFEIWYRNSFKYNNKRTETFLRSIHKTAEMSYCDGRITDLNNTGYLDLRYRDDYYFYLEYLLEQKENRPFSLLFPSINKVGATEMQMLRSTPIHPIGISIVPVFADLSIMSQTNFVWHDINHARRNVQHNTYHFNKFSNAFDNKIDNYFIEMYIFQKKLLEKIKIKKTDTDLDKNMKRWMKLIIFDTVHEDAMPYLPEVIIHNTLKPSNVCYPFESPNMVCGNNNKRIIRKFHGKGASTLAIMFTKIRYEFYEKETPLEFILGAKYRTTYHLSIATTELIRIILDICPHIKFTIGFKNIRKRIIDLISDKTNTERGILVPLKGLPDDSDPSKQIDPSSDEYKWIKSINGNVFPTDESYGLSEDYVKPEYKQDYTSYTEIVLNEMFWKTTSLETASPEMDVSQYIRNQGEYKLNDINILNVKEISPKIDLTVLNKWRNMDTTKVVEDEMVKGIDPEEQRDGTRGIQNRYTLRRRDTKSKRKTKR